MKRKKPRVIGSARYYAQENGRLMARKQFQFWARVCLFAALLGLVSCVTVGPPGAKFVNAAVYSKGTDALVKLDDTGIVLAGQPWLEQPTRFKLQVAGPHGAGTAASGGFHFGEAGYVRTEYLGNGK